MKPIRMKEMIRYSFAQRLLSSHGSPTEKPMFTSAISTSELNSTPLADIMSFLGANSVILGGSFYCWSISTDINDKTLKDISDLRILLVQRKLQAERNMRMKDKRLAKKKIHNTVVFSIVVGTLLTALFWKKQ